MATRTIIHVDMDAFYPAVEVMDFPDLAGRPVIVGGGGDRGVVSSASYEARRFGVRSAMPIVTARKLCPQGVYQPVRMERYAQVSRRVFEVFFHFTPLVEPLSIDEAFLDVTASARLFGDGREVARLIRQKIEADLNLTASAGVAPSKLVAKIASDLCKPDGLLVVDPGRVQEFLDPLPVSRMWGVGPVAQKTLARMGASTIGQVRGMPREALCAKLGKYGDALYDFCRGIDPRRVQPPQKAKSIGKERTFSKDLTDREEAVRRILGLCQGVARRARKKGVEGRTVHLKVKYADFTLNTRSVSLSSPTDDAGRMFAASRDLLEKTQVGSRPVRLLGVSLSSLTSEGGPVQSDLFDWGEPKEKRKKLHQAIDAIKDEFGEAAIGPAALLPGPEEE